MKVVRNQCSGFRKNLLRIAACTMLLENCFTAEAQQPAEKIPRKELTGSRSEI